MEFMEFPTLTKIMVFIEKVFAFIGLAIFAVVRFPFWVMKYITKGILNLIGLSSIVPVVITYGMFGYGLYMTAIQVIDSGDVVNFIFCFVGFCIFSAILGFFLSIWAGAAELVTKVLMCVELVFSLIELYLFQAQSFCKRHLTFSFN